MMNWALLDSQRHAVFNLKETMCWGYRILFAVVNFWQSARHQLDPEKPFDRENKQTNKNHNNKKKMI